MNGSFIRKERPKHENRIFYHFIAPVNNKMVTPKVKAKIDIKFQKQVSITKGIIIEHMSIYLVITLMGLSGTASSRSLSI